MYKHKVYFLSGPYSTRINPVNTAINQFFISFFYNSHAEKKQPSLVVAMNRHKFFENIFTEMLSFSLILSK